MQFPKFLQLLEPVESLTLLYCNRSKGGLWKVAFSVGDGILIVNLPDNAVDRDDMVGALELVADAIRRDPAPQLPLKPQSKPSAEDRSGFLSELTPESRKSTEAQTELGLPEPDPPPITEFGDGPPIEATSAPETVETIEDYLTRKPRGRRPKPGTRKFDGDQGSVELPSVMVVARWTADEKPPESVDIAGLNVLTLAGKTRGAYAGVIVQGQWCMAWNSEAAKFVRLQACFPAKAPKIRQSVESPES